MNKISRFFNKIVLSLAIIFVVFQPVIVPTAHAVTSWSGQSWEGDTWDGDSWSGDSWDGSNLKWEGQDWSGDSWTDNSWDGDSWLGNDFSGDSYTGNDWLGNDFSGDSYLGDSWSGNDFSGDSYLGDSWLGSNFTGNSYVGNSWFGNNFTGDTYIGNPWLGNNFSGNSYLGNNFSGNSYLGNPWLGNNFLGNSHTGNPWVGTDYAGNPYTGNPWLSQAYLGNPWQNSSFLGNAYSSGGGGSASAFAGDPFIYTPPERFYDTTEYKATDLLINKMTLGTIEQIDGMLNNPDYTHRDLSGFVTDLIVSNSKLHLGSHTFFDGYDLVKTTKTGFDKVMELEQMRKMQSNANTVTQTVKSANAVSNASKVSQYGSLIKDSAKTLAKNTDISNLSNTWGKMGALSKFNGVTSAINAGVSAYKTGASIGDSIHVMKSDASGAEKTAAVAEVGTNFGETLMSVGTVASVIPGGQAVGAGLIAAGAGIFAISKGTQMIANNAGKIKAGAKKAWGKITGLFSKG